MSKLPESEYTQVNLEERNDTKEKLHTLPPPSPGVSTAEFSGGSICIGTLEREMIEPDGCIAFLRKRVTFLEERRANNMIERGNRIFKDYRAVDAFVVSTETNIYTDIILIL